MTVTSAVSMPVTVLSQSSLIKKFLAPGLGVPESNVKVAINFFGQGTPCFSVEGNARSFFLDKNC